MKNKNLEIKILVENSKGTPAKWITIPTSSERIIDEINSFASIKNRNSYRYRRCESNCGIFIEFEEEILQFNKKISFLDTFVTSDEVKALMECFNYKLTDLIKVVKQHNYEFFPNKTLDDILSEEELYNVDIADEEDLINNGYSQTSTGVLKINNEEGEI